MNNKRFIFLCLALVLLNILALLGVSAAGTTDAGRDLQKYDLNGDNRISIADVTQLLDYLASECGHAVVTDPAVEPTCTKTGLTEGAHCSICKAVLTPQQEVAAKDHSYANHKCTICGAAEVSEGLKYALDGDSYIVTGIGSCEDVHLVIPETYKNKPVAAIADMAFMNCTYLKSVTVPSCITRIGRSAFEGCSGLQSITLPFVGDGSANTHFGYIFGASDYGSHASYVPALLETVVLAEGKSIDANAFNDCSKLKSIVIPDSVTGIGDSAFNGCTGLTSITVPRSVTNIGTGIFSNCSGLTSLAVEKDNSVYYSEANCIIRKDNKKLIVGCKTSVIPENVTSIGQCAFKGCVGLTDITIPCCITSIEFAAFEGCTGLQSITLPFVGATATGSSSSHFGHIFGASTGTKNPSFVPESIKSVTITGGSTIGSCAFYNCAGLTSISLPNSITSIQSYAFLGCNRLLNMTIPSSVTSIGANAFASCSKLKTVSIPNSVKIIENHAFYDCAALTAVVLPDGITTIEDWVFHRCSSLTSISLPVGVTSIGNGAFYACTGLTSITLPASVQTIGESAFYNCTKMTVFTIPDGVKTIGASAFSGCSGLTSVTVPNSVTSIGLSAFSGCSKLTSITIPFVGASKDGSTNTHFGYIFGASSYSYNSSNIPASLKTVVITGGTSIGSSAFQNCSGLTSVTIPDSVIRIGNYAFYGCKGLTSILIPDSIDHIGEYAFSGCSGLTSIVIPDGLSSIESLAFYKCTGLTSIVIPESVTSLGAYVFSNCTNLTKIYCEATSIPADWRYWDSYCSATVHWGNEWAYVGGVPTLK